MLLVPNVGELVFLEWIVDRLNSDGVTVRLFQNDHTPGDADEEGDYTVASFDGYDAIAADAWQPPFTDGDEYAHTFHAACTWTNTGVTANTIYGYFVVKSVDGSQILWAERFESPVVIDTPGQSLSITPHFTLRSQPPA